MSDSPVPLRRPSGHVAAALLLALATVLMSPALMSPAHSDAAEPSLASTGRMEVNAMEYPWSAIGRVNVGGRGHCTGFVGCRPCLFFSMPSPGAAGGFVRTTDMISKG